MTTKVVATTANWFTYANNLLFFRCWFFEQLTC